MSNIYQRLNFYISSNFGIKYSDLVEPNAEMLRTIGLKCSNKAYQDLKRRMPYKYSASKLKNMSNDIRKDFETTKSAYIDEINSTIIDKIVNKKGEIEYKKFSPVNIIKEIISLSNNKYKEVFKENRAFTVGLAQKWVNMTIKYLWILGIYNDDHEARIEVPIDSYIIENMKEVGIVINSKWSDWNDIDEYIAVQSKILEVVKPQTRIGWENEVWSDSVVFARD